MQTPFSTIFVLWMPPTNWTVSRTILLISACFLVFLLTIGPKALWMAFNGIGHSKSVIILWISSMVRISSVSLGGKQARIKIQLGIECLDCCATGMLCFASNARMSTSNFWRYTCEPIGKLRRSLPPARYMESFILVLFKTHSLFWFR